MSRLGDIDMSCGAADLCDSSAGSGGKVHYAGLAVIVLREDRWSF